MNFSVCTSVYKNDKPCYIQQAFNSLINQTLKPSEIIVVVDGPISSDIESVLKYYIDNEPLFKVHYLEQNVGLGNAMNLALGLATYDIVARMDSDDISVPDRFEKQINILKENPNISIIGGAILEFIETPSNALGKRVCPLSNAEIKNYMKSRCGFNHVTVMFRKNDVLKAGGYKDWFWNEDYYLWIRMMMNNCLFMNIEDVLVNVRVGKDMYARRGGLKYFKSEYKLQKFMLKNKVINFFRFFYNVSARFIIEILMPNPMRAWIYKHLLRKNETVG